MTTRSIHLKKTVDGMYRPHRKHKALFADKFKREWIHPDMLEMVATCQTHLQQQQQKLLEKQADGGKEEPNKTESQSPVQPQEAKMDPTHLAPMLQVEIPGVYSFRPFASEFLQIFVEEMEHFDVISKEYQIPVRRPNSMNNYGVVVNEIGMRDLLSSFQHDYLWPLAKCLFPKEASHPFDGHHHSFLVRYEASEDAGLDMHTDDSDVTFNVCLGEAGFEGSTLTFCGMFGSAHHRQYQHTYPHEIGRAALHLGSQRHGADDITSGRRTNLIVWNHNLHWRNSLEYTDIRRLYQKEDAPPDEVCLSFTHDVDYIAYKDLPERTNNLQLHPWCPPEGMEYDGFDQAMQNSLTRKSRSSTTRGRVFRPESSLLILLLVLMATPPASGLEDSSSPQEQHHEHHHEHHDVAQQQELLMEESAAMGETSHVNFAGADVNDDMLHDHHNHVSNHQQHIHEHDHHHKHHHDDDNNISFCQGAVSTMFMDGFHFSLFPSEKDNSTNNHSPPPPCLAYYVSTWQLTESGKFRGAMVFSFLLALLTEALSASRLRWIRFLHSYYSAAAPTGLRTRKHKIILTVVYALQQWMGTMIMLISMAYSIELLASVVAGLMAGHFLFVRDHVQVHANNNNYTTITTGGGESARSGGGTHAIRRPIGSTDTASPAGSSCCGESVVSGQRPRPPVPVASTHKED